MDIKNILDKYKEFIALFCLLSFLNVYYIYVYLSPYLISFLYYSDTNFNYFLYKLIIPIHSLGYLFSGLSVKFFINIFAYKKTIKYFSILLSLVLMLQSYNNSCIILLSIAFVTGYISNLLFIFIINLGCSLYYDNIGFVGSSLAIALILSFIPINILGKFYINPLNKTQTIEILNGILIFEQEIGARTNYFIFYYAVFLLFLSIICCYFIKNPEGIESKISIYFKNYILHDKPLNEEDTNFRKSQYKSSLLNINNYDANNNTKIKKTEDILLKEDNTNNAINNDEITEQIIYQNLFSKRFIILYFYFVSIYIISTYYVLNLKDIGFTFFDDETVVNLGLFFFFMNIIGRPIAGYLLKKYRFKNVLGLGLSLYIIGIIFRLLFNNFSFLGYILAYSIIFLGNAISITCYHLSSKLLYGNNNLSTILQGVLGSTSVMSNIIEYIFEITIKYIFGFFASEIILFIIMLFSVYLLKILNIK